MRFLKRPFANTFTELKKKKIEARFFEKKKKKSAAARFVFYEICHATFQ